MPIFSFEDIDFYYEDDDNNGEPFVFLHGLGGDTSQTMGIMKQTEGIRRISMDFRGHGKTIDIGRRDKLSFEQFTRDILALVNHLNLGRVIIGGVSTGAGVALRFSLTNPQLVSKLVLSRPAWKDEPQSREIIEAYQQIYDILVDNSVKDKKTAYKATKIYKHMKSVSKYAGETLLGQFEYPYAKDTASKLIKIPRDCPNSNRDDWKNIIVPTLILVSEQDPIHPYEYGVLLNNFIPNSSLKRITPKEVSGQQHNIDSYNFICDFV